MNASRRRHAHALYATSHQHDQDRPRLERFRNLEPPTAELLGVLIRAAGSRRILELGTSNGYSTIWLADAAEANGGRVVSVDLDRARTDLARESLLGAGLERRVELRTAGYVLDPVRTLAPAGILAVDNVLTHENELVEFTALIEAREDLTQAVVPVGAGLRLCVRGRPE